MLLQPKIHLYMPKYIVVIFRNFSAQNACAKILLRTQRVSVTWLKIGPCLRSRQKEWELDHYLFSSLWHVYLMFVISILENLKGKKIVFWDVTLTRLVPIWGVLPQCSYILFSVHFRTDSNSVRKKNLTKFYKIFRTELDSVRKQKTIFKPRKKCRTESDSVRKRISNILEIKNSESNPNRYRKICKTKLLICSSTLPTRPTYLT